MSDSVRSRLLLDTPPAVLYTHDEGDLVFCQSADLYHCFTERGITSLNSNIKYYPNGYLDLAYSVQKPMHIDWKSLRDKKVRLRLSAEQESGSWRLTLHDIRVT